VGGFCQWEGVTHVAEVAAFHEELGSYSKHKLQCMVHERDAVGRWACKRRVRRAQADEPAHPAAGGRGPRGMGVLVAIITRCALVESTCVFG
jgi:hypothetical protein